MAERLPVAFLAGLVSVLTPCVLPLVPGYLSAISAVGAAPCIGAGLGSILVLAGSAGSVIRGVVLLVAYSVGLGAAFVLAGVAFTRAMATFRWLRNRYRVLQVVGGAMLVALGLLLFFERYWWLQVALNRLLESVGLDRV